MLTTNEIIKITGIKPSTLAYLIREGKLPCVRRGKGVTTLFHEDAITKIEKYLAVTANSSFDGDITNEPGATSKS